MTRPVAPAPLAVWRALLTVHANLTQEIDGRLRRAGAIPLRWYDALLCLYEAPDRRLRLGDMAEAALLSRSGLSRLVQRLDEEGLLTREPALMDGRGAYAVLTPAGHDALRRAWSVYGPAIQDLFVRHLTAEEVAVLGPALSRVLRAGGPE